MSDNLEQDSIDFDCVTREAGKRVAADEAKDPKIAYKTINASQPRCIQTNLV
jgi:hypothetical protein